MHIVLAGGGTAGHVNPLLAVADAIRRIRPEASISIIGTAVGLEHDLVPRAGYELDTIEKVPFPRRPNKGRAPVSGQVDARDPQGPRYPAFASRGRCGRIRRLMPRLRCIPRRTGWAYPSSSMSRTPEPAWPTSSARVTLRSSVRRTRTPASSRDPGAVWSASAAVAAGDQHARGAVRVRSRVRAPVGGRGDGHRPSASHGAGHRRVAGRGQPEQGGGIQCRGAARTRAGRPSDRQGQDRRSALVGGRARQCRGLHRCGP